MSFNCGIVGLPNIGKSTLFNALTKSNAAEAANYPFCTINPNIGKVQIKDKRLDKIARIANSERVIYNQLEVVDIAGLVKGASKGEGLGNKFLSHIREVDVIIHLLRCFEDSKIGHVYNKIDPVFDAEIVEMELILADIDSIKKRLFHLEKKIRYADKDIKEYFNLMEEVLATLELGKPARVLRHFNNDKRKSLQLLTEKPMIYVCNVEDANFMTGNELSKKVEKIAKKNNSKFYFISVNLEAKIANLNSGKQKEKFLISNNYSLEDEKLNKIVHNIYNQVLNMITFFTVGLKEAHAWPIKIGQKADEAAGVIHTDFKKGFIKAEVINFIDYIRCGSELICRNMGKVFLKGRDYLVQDGDIIYFKFNVKH